MGKRIETVGVIGGGLAGLTAGLRLARRGVRVRLFEARSKPGGSCASTTLSGYTFNDGALYLAMPRLLDHVFAQLGLDRAMQLPLTRIDAPQTSWLPDGTRVVFGAGSDVRSIDAAGRVTPVDLARLIARWEPVLRVFGDELAIKPFSLLSVLRQAWRVLPRLRGTVAGEVTQLFDDEAVRAAMAGLVLYTGLPAFRTPAFQMLGLVCLFTEGFFVPAQGMGEIPRCLAQALQDAAGELNLGRRVRAIQLHAGRAAALVLDDGESVPVDAVVATMSGMHTVHLLGDAAPAAMRRKARNAPLSHRAIAIHLGLRERVDASSHGVTVLPWLREQGQYFAQDADVPRYFHYSVPTVTLPRLAPGSGSVIELFPPIPQDRAVDAWDDTALEAVVEGALAALRRRHRLDIEVMRVVGPKQYRDDLQLYEGAIYGLSPAADPRAMFPARTSVPGLFQAGQTTYPGYGVVSSALSGLFAADALLS